MGLVMQKTKYALLIACLVSALLCSCKNTDSKNTDSIEWLFTRTIAREVQKDGWCFSFAYERMKDPQKEFSGHIHYSFSGINLRYQYHPDYVMTYVRNEGEKTFIQEYVPGVLLWENGSTEQKEDIDFIMNEILVQTRSVDELLSLDPSEYHFKTIDTSLFFELMHEALSKDAEPEKETRQQLYADKPTYAMLVEPEYLDGYKFQIAFLIGLGYIDEIYIDVLYQTGSNYTDYIQLSDLVDSREVTEEQASAFETIRMITEKIRGTDNFLFCAEEFKNLSVAGIDFSRLYAFLRAIHSNDFTEYCSGSRVLSTYEKQ